MSTTRIVDAGKLAQHGGVGRPRDRPLDEELQLRPLTERDWDTIARWETDPEVLWFSEGDEPREWTIEEWQPIYRDIRNPRSCSL